MFIIIGIIVVVGILYFLIKGVTQSQVEKAEAIFERVESQLSPVVTKFEEKVAPVVETPKVVEPEVSPVEVKVEEPVKKVRKPRTKTAVKKAAKKAVKKVAKKVSKRG